MARLYMFLSKLRRDERAQDMVEYAFAGRLYRRRRGWSAPGHRRWHQYHFQQDGQPSQQRGSSVISLQCRSAGAVLVQPERESERSALV